MNTMNQNTRLTLVNALCKLFYCVALPILLASCGGGGSDPKPPTTTLEKPSLTNIAAAQSYPINQAITTLTFKNDGGAVVSCSTSSDLPKGLELVASGNTCQITGTPTEEVAANDYTITATNTAGTGTATVNIAVFVPISITNVELTSSAARTTPLADDVLTLTFETTGQISFNPQVTIGGQLAEVAQGDTEGKWVATLTVGPNFVSPEGGFAVIVVVPNGVSSTEHLSQSATVAAVQNTAASLELTGTDTFILTPILTLETTSYSFEKDKLITPITFINEGGDVATDGCNVNTPLPQGLSLNVSGTTCEITGMPDTVTDSGDYIITATNATGEGMITVTIGVNIPSVAPALADITEAQSFAVGQTITAITFANTGNAAISCSVADTDTALPQGLELDVSGTTCEITGVPMLAATSTEYTITAEDSAGGLDTATVTITINKGTDTLSFPQSIVTAALGDGAITSQVVTAASGMGTITYASDDDAVATVDANSGAVTLASAGLAKITATRAEGANYLVATATYTLIVNDPSKTNDILSFATTVTNTLVTAGDGSASVDYAVNLMFTRAATSTNALGAVTYVSDKPTVATVDSSGLVIIVSAGTAIITATREADETYNPSVIAYTLTVNKGTDTLSFTTTDVSATFGDPQITTQTPVGGNGTGNITYASSDTTNAVVEVDTNSGAITIVAVGGPITITATRATDANYNTVSAMYTITVNQAADTLTFGTVSDGAVEKTFNDAAFTEAATSASARMGITYRVLVSGGANDGMVDVATDMIATVDGTSGEVTIAGAGTVIIEATLAADTNYLVATTTYTLTVNQATDTLTFGGVTDGAGGTVSAVTVTDGVASVNFAANPVFTRVATAMSARAGITYTSDDDLVATVGEGSGAVTIKLAGIARITATLMADDNYLVATATYTLIVNDPSKTDDTLSFATTVTNTAVMIAGDGSASVVYDADNLSFTRVATSANARAGITYRVLTSSSDVNTATDMIATVDASGEVTITGAGTVIIEATLAGDTTYNPIIATYTLTVNKADDTLSFAQSDVMATFGDTVIDTQAATSGSGMGMIIYKSGNTNIATVATNGDVTIVGAGGPIMIMATRVADANYNEVTAMYTLTVAKADDILSFIITDVSAALGDPQIKTQTPMGGNGGGDITYASSDNTNVVVEVDAATGAVTIVAVGGPITITATRAADDNYNMVSAIYTITVTEPGKQTDALTFGDVTDDAGGAVPAVTATDGAASVEFVANLMFTRVATSTTAPAVVTYRVLTSANTLDTTATDMIATVDEDGEVTIAGVGTVIIEATRAADTNYLVATARYTLTVNDPAKQNDALTFGPVTDGAGGAVPAVSAPDATTASVTYAAGLTFTRTATSTTAPVAVTYRVLTSANTLDTTATDMIATVHEDLGLVTIAGAGVVIIEATRIADDTYNGDTTSYTLTVNKADDDLTFAATVTNTAVTASDGAASVTYAADLMFTRAATSASTNASARITYEALDSSAMNSSGTSVAASTIANVDGAGLVTIAGAGTVVIEATRIADNNYNGDTTRYTLTVNQATDTLTFSSTATNQMGGTVTATDGAASVDFAANLKFTRVATATSTRGGIAYRVLDSTGMPDMTATNAIATVDGDGRVTIAGVGIVLIEATLAADTNYLVATQTYTLTVNDPAKQTDTLTFSPTVTGTSADLVTVNPDDGSASITYADSSLTFIRVARSGSGLGVITYTSNMPDTATVNPTTGEVTIEGGGTAEITANRAEDDDYNGISETYTLTINKATDAISFPQPTAMVTFGEAPSTPQAATTVSGVGTITYASNNEDDATVNNDGLVTILGAGEVIIEATRVEDDNYIETTTTYTLTINKATDAISFSQPTAMVTFGEAPSTPQAATTVSGVGTITYASNNEDDATVNDDGLVTILGAGEVIIEATRVEDDNYIETTTTYTLTINKATDAISFSQPTAMVTFGEAPSTPQAATTVSGVGTITYASNNEDDATVNNDGLVTILGAGEVIIEATRVEDDNYIETTTTYTLTINKATDAISFSQPTAMVTFGEAPSTPQAATTVSGVGTITYASNNEDDATVNDDGLVTILGAGEVIIEATRVEDDNYIETTTTYTLTINKATDAISFSQPTAMVTFGEAPSTPQAATTVSGVGTITYASNNEDDATVNNDGLVTILGAGEVIIEATRVEDDNYIETTTTYTLTINKATDAISFSQPTAMVTFGEAPSTPQAATTVSGVGTITYASNNEDDATVNNDGLVTILGAGEVIIEATRVEDDNYIETTTTYTLTINKATDAISFSQPTAMVTFGEAPSTPQAATTVSGVGTITYASNNEDDATVNNDGLVTILGAGEVIIEATRVEDDNYIETTTTYTLTINKATDAISFSQPTAMVTFGEAPSTPQAATTVSGVGTITYASNNEDDATVNNDGLVTILGAGEVIIEATRVEDDNYIETTATYTLTINKATDAISFSQPTAMVTFGEAPSTPQAATTVSGVGTITYASNNEDDATVNNDGLVTILGAGEVIIEATRVEDDNYIETTATYTLTINKATDAISFSQPTAMVTFGEAPSTPQAATTVSGVGTITYASNNEDDATVNNDGLVTILGAGEVIIEATRVEDDNYIETTTTYTLTINKATDAISFSQPTAMVTFGEAPSTPQAATTVSGVGTITYASNNEDDATVNNDGLVTILGAGEVIIEATRVEDDNYIETTTTYTLTINKATDAISFSQPTAMVTFGEATEHTSSCDNGEWSRNNHLRIKQ